MVLEFSILNWESITGFILASPAQSSTSIAFDVQKPVDAKQSGRLGTLKVLAALQHFL